MATINDKNLIDKLIANDGYFEDDERAAQIVEYTNKWGQVTWGITWRTNADIHKYEYETEYVRNPKVIWKAE